MNGRRAPNVRHLRAIAAALETSVSFLALTSNNSEPDSSELLPDDDADHLSEAAAEAVQPGGVGVIQIMHHQHPQHIQRNLLQIRRHRFDQLRRFGGPSNVIECAQFEGYPVELFCYKNSFGPGRRRILTRLLWWYVPDDDADPEDPGGGWKQKTIWDWEWSLVHLLDNLLHGDTKKANPMIRQSLKDHGVHVEVVGRGHVDGKAWSKNLGMAQKDAVSWSELGARLQGDPVVCRLLRRALRINERPHLQGDYLQQLEEMLNARGKKSAARPTVVRPARPPGPSPGAPGPPPGPAPVPPPQGGAGRKPRRRR
jgi:hypothetical protein